MPNYDERLAEIERSMVSRIDLINAINKLTLQQAQNASDTYHEITILLGVTGAQGQDIKAIKEDVSTIKERLNEHTGRFDRVETLLAQILARLPEKP